VIPLGSGKFGGRSAVAHVLLQMQTPQRWCHPEFCLRSPSVTWIILNFCPNQSTLVEGHAEGSLTKDLFEAR
jgi:hypothetical protein